MNEFVKHNIDWTDDKIGNLWDYYSTTSPYNTMYFTSKYASDILKISKKYVDINKKVVLDFGSGAGYLIDEIAISHNPSLYYALDFSQNSVEIAKNKNANFIIEPVLAKNFPSNIPSNSVDICFLIEVIEHLGDEHLRSTLGEIYRVLKSGGVLMLTTPNNEKLEENELLCPECGCIYHKWQHQRSWTKDSLIDELRKYKLIANDVFEINLKTKSLLSNLLQILRKIYKKSPCGNLIGIFVK